MKTIRQLLAIVSILGFTSAALAQAWPLKPIKIIVPYPPGGTSDILARSLGPKITEALGQPVIVENKAGATGNLGAAFHSCHLRRRLCGKASRVRKHSVITYEGYACRAVE